MSDEEVYKALRMVAWRPRIDKDIENFVHTCEECQKTQPSPPKAPLQFWSWPSRPWSRLHIDYAGPFENKMFLILVDAHTKWREIFPTTTSTSTTTITKLRQIFAQFGVPKNIVTDNGSCFTSTEFKNFLKSNGIDHFCTPHYHPQSNGLAERCVQIFKQGMRKIRNGTLEERLAKLLFNYWTTPHTTTGLTPGELMFGQHLSTRFDRIFPSVRDRVKESQERQKYSFDKHTQDRIFNVGDLVYVKNFYEGERWSAGKITRLIRNVMFEVFTEQL